MEIYTTELEKTDLSNDMETKRNHLIMKKHQTNTEGILTKVYCRLKELKAQPQVQFQIYLCASTPDWTFNNNKNKICPASRSSLLQYCNIAILFFKTAIPLNIKS